jgi:hypothetical protein
VRLSGAPYTIVRPGWLDTGPAGEHVTIDQGDTGDGSIGREVLGALHIAALVSDSAIGKTFEVFSGPGETTSDWDSLFGAAQPDAAGALDAIEDTATCRSKANRAQSRTTWLNCKRADRDSLPASKPCVSCDDGIRRLQAVVGAFRRRVRPRLRPRGGGRRTP